MDAIDRLLSEAQRLGLLMEPGSEVWMSDVRNCIKALEHIRGADLRPHPKNFRTHPTRQIEALRGVLNEVGIAGALLVYRADDGVMTLIDGECRSTHFAETVWPCLVLDVNDREADYLLATHDELSRLAEVDRALEDFRAHGPFDVVICDAVLNSVDSAQAETDVMTVVNAFCRQGGKVFFSGRRMESVTDTNRFTKDGNKRAKRRVEFLDGEGFSGLYRKGSWFYQKFHTAAQVRTLAERYFGDKAALMTCSHMAFQVAAVKRTQPPLADVLASAQREFDLPWPGGRTVNRGAAAVAVFEEVLHGSH